MPATAPAAPRGSVVVPSNVGAYTPPRPAGCAECDAALAGPFCAQCGQRAPGPDDLTLARFARAAAEEVSGTDARLVRSLWTLVRRPGLLTREFVDGHRRRWASPFQLFLLASAAYFFVGMPGWLRHTTMRTDLAAQVAAGVRATAAAAPARYPAAVVQRATPAVLGSDGVMDAWMALLGWGKFANLAVFALVTWALHRRRARGGVAPVTFALHYYAFDFLFFTALVPLLLAAARARGAPLSQAALLPLMLVNAGYLYLALRRAWNDRPARAGLKMGALLATDMAVSSATTAAALGAVVGRVLAGTT